MEISKGAEATLYLREYNGEKVVEKKRHRKEYRIKEIDEKIRKERTRRESKYIRKMSGVISCPKIVDVKDYSILMEYVDGTLAKNYNLEEIAVRIGEMVAERVEDKSMDLVVFKKILLASNADVFEKVWKLFLKGYKKSEQSSEIINRIDQIENRWRYKKKG
jgi:tRNA A-37 threonylcarbamoyl transferase component Bud32